MGAWADATFRRMTLEEKVGQVICFRGVKHRDATLAMAREGRVGSVAPAYFEGMTRSLPDMVAFMNDLLRAAPVPPLFLGGWLAGVPRWGATPLPDASSMMLLGAARDPALAEAFGRAASREAKAAGFDLVWEPCVDVNTEPRNPIIGSRAFSDRPELVIAMARAVVRGMQAERVIPNAKHFPGHGDTAFDTHVKIGVVARDRARVDAVELAPYRALIRDGLRGVMTAHLIFPALDPTPDLPATLSRRCIRDLLRDAMGFQGLIVSDSLTMRAIKHHFGVKEAAVRTLAAGHDIILHDYEEPPEPTFEAVLRAVKKGALREDELDAAVRRVLEQKEWAGLPARGPIRVENLAALANGPEHAALAQRLFEAGLTVLENDGLPLAPSGEGVCVIATRAKEEGQAATDFGTVVENARDTFLRELRRRMGGVKEHIVPEDPTPAEVEAAVRAAADARLVIFATFPRILCYKELSGGVGAGQVEIVRAVQAGGRRVALCVLGSPYVIAGFPRTDICLTTYSPDPGAGTAAARVLFGDFTPRGRLPVDLSKVYPFGAGI